MNPARVRFLLTALVWPLAAAAAHAAEPAPLKVLKLDQSRFPAGLIAQGITQGDASVLLSIDVTGKVDDAFVTRATHRILANEALRLLRGAQFEPAVIRGEPTPVLREVHFHFEATGAIISLDPITAVEQRTRSFAHPDYLKFLFSAGELDALPTPTHHVSPRNPGRIGTASAASEPVILEFIVDESGRPRLPALVKTPHPLYADLATEALLQWRFTPPLRHGQPVAVRVQQAFIFPES